jgi:hypothetical protein
MIIWWYNTYLQHQSTTRMEAALMQHLVWPNLKKDVEAAKNCHECQICKTVRKTYVELPDKLAERPIAWNSVY